MSAAERLAAALCGIDVDDPDADRIAADALAADPTLAQDLEAGQRLREAIERMDAGQVVDFADIPREDPADEQDRLDGRALRELREAWHGTWSVHVVRSAGRVVGYTVEAWSTTTWPTVKVYGPDDDSMPDVYPTIAAAADACRAALEGKP